MQSNFYRTTYVPGPLPEDPSELIPSARNFVLDLIGHDTTGLDFSIENHEDSIIIFISVPTDMISLNDTIAAAGFDLLHQGPTAPTVDENSITISRAFQIRNFYHTISPQSVSDNPSAMASMASAISDATAALGSTVPPGAIDSRQWAGMASDPDTEALTIYWYTDPEN